MPSPPSPFTALQLIIGEHLLDVQVHASRTSTFADIGQLSDYLWHERIHGVHSDLTINPPGVESLDTLCSALHEFADVRMLSIILDDQILSPSIFNSTFLSIFVLRLEHAFGEHPRVMLATPDESGTITTFPALRVLEFQTCDLDAVVGPAEDATAESSLVRILSARCQAGIPVSVVYLRLAEEIDDLRNGRQHSCSEYPDVAAVERAVDALIARPDVRIIGKEEVVPYAIYL